MFKTKLFLLTQHCLPQHFLSRMSAYLTNSKYPPLKNFLIKLACKHFKISLDNAERENVEDYESFNDFFTRALKADARQIDPDPKNLISPADGAVSQFGSITDQKLFQAKGKYFSLVDLLGGDVDTARQLENGTFFTIYLSPSDYHRVHIPFDGKLLKMTYIPGKLFSVNKVTAENIDGVFSRNERVVCYFETSFGIMPVIFVGALLVASIITKWHGIVAPSYYGEIKSWDYQNQNIQYKKGEEIGHFQFGSTVICCFPENVLSWHANMETSATISMGEIVGNI
jgi:phosphatidylserine decarboxylase